MSCTENESSPFVVFFLPAVVGCLTILLVRRWASSQVSNCSSTAVSRRRKIIKDPLIKRPLPPITCKMTPPGSKKSSGVSKKGSEEDSSGKRAVRTARFSPTTSPSAGLSDVTNKGAERDLGPVHPKHIPFPNLPQDGEILYETMSFVFTVVATGLQFLNLYRTAWWLPNSNTHQTMHFYLIDPHLVAFIVIILSRRFLMSITLAAVKSVVPTRLAPHATIATRMFILGVVLGGLAWCTYFIMIKHNMLKMFYLCYPAIVYFLLFGFQSAPFLEFHNRDTPLLHCCSHDPEQIRAEVETMRQDFNMRFKKVIFNSVVGAYYSSFIPCCFAQPFLYYDVVLAAQQTGLVWGSLAARGAAALPPADPCHRAALHLSCWNQLSHHGTSCCVVSDVPLWTGSRLWARRSRVSHHGVAYEAAATTAAVPGLTSHARFYAVFKNPSTLLCLLVCMQLSLIVVQFLLLFSRIPWHGFISIVLLLFINYYTLFKLFRDYLVSWKVYKAEHMIQDKSHNPSCNVNN